MPPEGTDYYDFIFRINADKTIESSGGMNRLAFEELADAAEKGTASIQVGGDLPKKKQYRATLEIIKGADDAEGSALITVRALTKKQYLQLFGLFDMSHSGVPQSVNRLKQKLREFRIELKEITGSL